MEQCRRKCRNLKSATIISWLSLVGHYALELLCPLGILCIFVICLPFHQAICGHGSQEPIPFRPAKEGELFFLEDRDINLVELALATNIPKGCAETMVRGMSHSLLPLNFIFFKINLRGGLIYFYLRLST